MSVDLEPLERRCDCGVILSRYNSGARCGPCDARAHADELDAPDAAARRKLSRRKPPRPRNAGQFPRRLTLTTGRARCVEDGCELESRYESVRCHAHYLEHARSRAAQRRATIDRSADPNTEDRSHGTHT